MYHTADIIEAAWEQTPPEGLATADAWDPDEEDQSLYAFYNEKAATEEESRPSDRTRQLVGEIMRRFLAEPIGTSQYNEESAEQLTDLDKLEKASDNTDNRIRKTIEFKSTYARAVKAERAHRKGDFTQALENNLALLHQLRAFSEICQRTVAESNLRAAVFYPRDKDGNGAARPFDLYYEHDLRPYYAIKQSVEFLTFGSSHLESIGWLERTFLGLPNASQALFIVQMFATARSWRVTFDRGVEVIRSNPGVLQTDVRRLLSENPGRFGFMLGHAASAGAIIRTAKGKGWKLSLPDQVPDPWPNLKLKLGLQTGE